MYQKKIPVVVSIDHKIDHKVAIDHHILVY